MQRGRQRLVVAPEQMKLGLAQSASAAHIVPFGDGGVQVAPPSAGTPVTQMSPPEVPLVELWPLELEVEVCPEVPVVPPLEVVDDWATEVQRPPSPHLPVQQSRSTTQAARLRKETSGLDGTQEQVAAPASMKQPAAQPKLAW